ncbi:Isoprenylcysteine carboxyl methyltransferase family-domain-containing protein [Trichophaea hybrida]|nr:Isoprenylcysteine carboxyl methyltransferase family-domain-containing protein [Trichophaea hybrida]
MSFEPSAFSDCRGSSQNLPRHSHRQVHSADLLPSGDIALAGIALRAGALCFICAFALNATWALRASFPQLPFFIALLAFFHFMEFWTTAQYNTRRAKLEGMIAFILTTNGAAYNIAHMSAIFEATIEFYLYPSLKKQCVVTIFGLILVVVGQLSRTYAMKHAGSNFSHHVAQKLEAEHTLVTSGIYSYLRHPAYFGYYWWAIGTQIMLGNPVCTVGFAAFLWWFFNTRIRHEERHLMVFFKRYSEYRSRSWVGILFAG